MKSANRSARVATRSRHASTGCNGSLTTCTSPPRRSTLLSPRGRILKGTTTPSSAHQAMRTNARTNKQTQPLTANWLRKRAAPVNQRCARCALTVLPASLPGARHQVRRGRRRRLPPFVELPDPHARRLPRPSRPLRQHCIRAIPCCVCARVRSSVRGCRCSREVGPFLRFSSSRRNMRRSQLRASCVSCAKRACPRTGSSSCVVTVRCATTLHGLALCGTRALYLRPPSRRTFPPFRPFPSPRLA